MIEYGAVSNAATTLQQQVDTFSTQIIVADASIFPVPPFIIRIDDELMKVISVNTDTNVLMVERGYNGTIAQIHAQNSKVVYVWTPELYETLKANFNNHTAATHGTHGVDSPYYIAKTSRSDQFPDWNDIQNKPSPKIILSGNVSGSATLTDLSNDVNISVTVADDSHQHSIQTITDIFIDTAANKPDPGMRGRLFFETDTHIIWYDNGTQWVKLAAADWSNIEGKPTPVITINGDISGTGTLTDLENLTIFATVNDDSHTHSDATITSVDWSKLRNLPSPIITLNGDVSGSGIMNNLGSVEINVTVVDDSHKHTLSTIEDILVDTSADRPAAGSQGRLFFETDTRIIYYDDGSQWIKLATVDWENIDGKPSVFSPEPHTHESSEITDLSSASVGYATSAGNADAVDGYHAGNESGQIPISNGTVNVDLNADLLDGYHATSFPEKLTANIEVTVGNNGDFSTLQEAIEFLVNKYYPQYISEGVVPSVTIRMLSGYILTSPVIIDGLNLSWIKITGDDASTPVDATGWKSFETPWAPGTNIGQPAFVLQRGAQGPRIAQIFEMIGSVPQAIRGLYVTQGSVAVVEPGQGFKSFNSDGVTVVYGGTLLAPGAVFSGSGNNGIYQSYGARVVQPGALLTNNHRGAYITYGSVANLRAADATDCVVDGICSYGAFVEATSAKATTLRVEGAGILLAADAIGSLSQVANTITSNGLIIQ